MVSGLIVRSLGVSDRGTVGIDLATQDIGVGRRECGGEPLYADKYVAIPIGWRRRSHGYGNRNPNEEQVERERAQKPT